MYVFQTLHEVREQTEKWIKEYDEERPHESLRDLTPGPKCVTLTAQVCSSSSVNGLTLTT